MGLPPHTAEKLGEAREPLSPKASPEELETSLPSSLEATLRAPNPRGALLSPEGHHSQTSLEGILIKAVST